MFSNENSKLASGALSILCPQVKEKKRKLIELRNRWFTRLKLIVLVCFRTTMGLCGFNSTAPLDLVAIEFRVRSSSSSAFMFAPKPDPVRLESNASAWKSYDMQLQYFNIKSQRFNSRLSSWQSAWRLFSLFKYHCFSQSYYFLISLEIIPNNASSNKGGGGGFC